MTSHHQMRRLLGVATILATMLLALLVFGTARSAARRKPAGEAREDGPAAETRGPDQGDARALRREVALLRREVARGRGPAQAEDAVGDEAERQKLVAEGERRVLAQAEANEAALRAEPTDRAWSRQASDLIGEALASEVLAATSLVELDCRSTLCRVRVRHADGAARAMFEQEFALQVGRLLPRVMAQQVESEDGQATSILYLAREGHEFPASN